VSLSPSYDDRQILTFSRHDFNENLGKIKVQSFIEKFPDAVADFRSAWIEYMKYCYQVESGEVVESVAEIQPVTLMELDRDPKGYPLVPDEGGNLANMKRIIRSFVTAHYRKEDLFYYLNVELIYVLQVLHLAGNKIESLGSK
jgi:hypothetical protein